MPQGETFWNPYRWVRVPKIPPKREEPYYHHNFRGVRGFMECRLLALTPILIGGAQKTQMGTQEIRFLRSKRTNNFVIPGTSLKGMIRSLFEVLANAAIPFPNGRSDEKHSLDMASDRQAPPRELDLAARVFGFLHRGAVFRGLVRFSDAHPVTAVREIRPFKVVVGQPRPDSHQPFYPDEYRRKFYHHHPAATHKLVPAPPEIKQTRTVYPLPSGTEFSFRVDFENLREEELDLLLYCLVLEDEVTVTLSPEALGPQYAAPVTFSGPMRHKLGACKPQGAGSVQVTIEKLVLFEDPAERYRGKDIKGRELCGDSLKGYVDQARERALQRIHRETLEDLRAMMIFSPQDPRKDIHYPDWAWFRSLKAKNTPLKPTR